MWVALVFSLLAAANVLTLALGPGSVLAGLANLYGGVVLAALVFDTWGTVGGLLGVVVLFARVLFGEKAEERRGASAFFVAASLLIGFGVSLGWNLFYNAPGVVGAGSSSVAIAAQGIVFSFSAFGLIRLFLGVAENRGKVETVYFALVYATIMASTLFFVLFLQPIFVPSQAYNWMAHGMGFGLGVLTACGYEGYRRFSAHGYGRTSGHAAGAASGQ